MFIGTSKILLSTIECNSLKEKRCIIKSIKEKISNRFNISIAEIELLDNRKKGCIGIVCISNEHRIVNSMINQAIDFIEQHYPGRIIDWDLEIMYRE